MRFSGRTLVVLSNLRLIKHRQTVRMCRILGPIPTREFYFRFIFKRFSPHSVIPLTVENVPSISPKPLLEAVNFLLKPKSRQFRGAVRIPVQVRPRLRFRITRVNCFFRRARLSFAGRANRIVKLFGPGTQSHIYKDSAGSRNDSELIKRKL